MLIFPPWILIGGLLVALACTSSKGEEQQKREVVSEKKDPQSNRSRRKAGEFENDGIQ